MSWPFDFQESSNNTVTELNLKPGFGWDGVNFPHSSLYGGVFWICDENSADKGMFCLLLNSAHSASRPSPPHQWEGWDAQAVGTQPGQLTPTDQRDSPSHTMSCSATKTGGKTEEGGVMFRVTAFVFSGNHYAQWLAGDGWTPACQCEAVN